MISTWSQMQLLTGNYVSGNWYNPYASAVLATGTAFGAAGTIVFVPFVITAPVTIKALGIRVITISAAGNLAIGIYAHNYATGRPTGTPLATLLGLSTGTATGVSANLATPLTLQPGLYWFATQCDNTTATFISLSNTVGWTGGLVGAAGFNVILGSANFSLAPTVLGGTYGTLGDMTSATFTDSNSSGVKAITPFFQVN